VSRRSPDQPYLSVVTPLYNCLPLTRAMLESLEASIPPRITYEVILVDDGSTDGTREWLKGLGAPYRVVLNETNQGFAGSTNRGAEVARGEVLALLNNDLVLEPGWLRPMLLVLRLLGRRAGLVGNIQLNASTREVDHAGIVVDEKCKPQHDRRDPSLLRRALRPVRTVFALTGACLIVRTETWRRLGGFDEGYRNGCEDVDVCLRAEQLGLRNVVVRWSRVLHHVSSSPGRKANDEANSRRLFLRWRDRLAFEACREWTWGYFTKLLEDPRDFPDPWDAVLTALYLMRLRRLPPAVAMEAKQAAIDLELARWQKMFSS